MNKPSEEAEDRRHQIEQLETILVAQDHATELVRLAAESSDADDLIQSIAATLNISDGYAQIVMVMSLERLATSYHREKLVAELAELRYREME